MGYFKVNYPHHRMYICIMYGVMNYSPTRSEHLWTVCIFKIFPELYLPGKMLCMGNWLLLSCYCICRTGFFTVADNTIILL